MKALKGALLVGALVALLAFSVWTGRKAPVIPPSTVDAIPVERLHAFAMTNAPTTSGGAWSTNQLGNPTQAMVLQQIAKAVRTTQASNPNLPPTKPAHGFSDAKWADGYQKLKSKVGPSLQVYLRPENGTPNQIKGWPLSKASQGLDESTRNETTAKDFLKDNASVLLIDHPETELQLSNISADGLGGAVARFTQQYKGLTVWPSEIGVHLDKKGDVDLVDCASMATPHEVDIQPALSPEIAQDRARGAVDGGTTAKLGTPQLVIYAPVASAAKLSWKLDVSVSLSQSWWVVVDAQTGQTLSKISRVMDSGVTGSGVDLLGVTRALSVWQQAGTYYMSDASKPMFNATTGEGFIEVEDARGTNVAVLQQAYFVTSASATSWDNPEAVSASYNLSQTYDYYEARFGRHSYNGAGSNLNAIVRIGNYANASWNGELKRMLFGTVDRYAASLDVIGHEVTHGVVSSIGSQGVLFYQDQSGALNESFADIFGEMVEARTRGTNDWLIGSQMLNPIRSMANPAAYGQPSRMSQYNHTTQDSGGVHDNSGIINRAYYLLAAGLEGAVGNDDAQQIFYRCLTVSMKPFSQFIDARLGCVAAAETIFGINSKQALKTAEAFDSVELYVAPVSTPEPTDPNGPVSADDSAMIVRSGLFQTDLLRLETAKSDPAGGRALINGVKLSRPGISGDGEIMFLIGDDEGLYSTATDGGVLTDFKIPGAVHSLALSPQGRYLAFVFNAATGVPTNQIVVLDLVSNLTSTVNLATPVSDGPPLNNISYADQLSFSPDGKQLIYDALSRIRRANGTSHEAWSIFGLDMNTLQQRVVVPTEEDFAIGDPAFGHTSGRYIVFEAQHTNGNSAVLTLDLYNGTLGGIGLSRNGLGFPVFSGDDTRVFFADEDASAFSGRSIYSQSLSESKLEPSGNKALAIEDADLAVIYRRGALPNINQEPLISLTAPLQNAVFVSPATVTISASTSDADGSVAKVEFYQGDDLVFTDTSAPYSVVLSALRSGVYSVYARAYDNRGASSTTEPLRFTVEPPGQKPVMNKGETPGFEFSLRLQQAGRARLEASTNLVDWTSLGSFLVSTNLGYFDPAATNIPRRFYRAVPAE